MNNYVPLRFEKCYVLSCVDRDYREYYESAKWSYQKKKGAISRTRFFDRKWKVEETGIGWNYDLYP